MKSSMKAKTFVLALTTLFVTQPVAAVNYAKISKAALIGVAGWGVQKLFSDKVVKPHIYERNQNSEHDAIMKDAQSATEAIPLKIAGNLMKSNGHMNHFELSALNNGYNLGLSVTDFYNNYITPTLNFDYAKKASINAVYALSGLARIHISKIITDKLGKEYKPLIEIVGRKPMLGLTTRLVELVAKQIGWEKHLNLKVNTACSNVSYTLHTLHSDYQK